MYYVYKYISICINIYMYDHVCMLPKKNNSIYYLLAWALPAAEKWDQDLEQKMIVDPTLQFFFHFLIGFTGCQIVLPTVYHMIYDDI